MKGNLILRRARSTSGLRAAPPRELDPAEGAFDFRIEGGAADDHFLEIAAEEVLQGLAQVRIRREGSHERLVYLLYDQGNGINDVRADVGEGLRQDLGTRGLRKEMDMATHHHLEEELEHHAVHVRGREDDDDVGGVVDHRQVLVHEGDVGPDGAVGDHHALGKAGSTGGIAQDGQFVGLILVIMQVLGADAARIDLLVHLFQLRPGRFGDPFLQMQDLVVLDLDDGDEAGHVLRVQAVPDSPLYEEDLRVGMVHQVVDVPGLELVQQRDGNGTVGHRGQETDRPVGLVAGNDDDLVAGPDPVMLVGQVHLRDAARKVTVQERLALVVGKGGTPPVIAETLLEEFVDGFGFQILFV